MTLPLAVASNYLGYDSSCNSIQYSVSGEEIIWEFPKIGDPNMVL